MNYLAHLYFAQDNPLSVTGNLMGDFTKGVDMSILPTGIVQGIKNHRAIDKFTDHHPLVKTLKPLLSAERQRFAAIISDVVFDHFLVIHWARFSEQDFALFVQQSYWQLQQAKQHMPERMLHVVTHMSNSDWLGSYRDIDVIGRALDSISHRIRFENNLSGAIVEVKANYQEYERVFLTFFPHLIDYVKRLKLEQDH